MARPKGHVDVIGMIESAMMHEMWFQAVVESSYRVGMDLDTVD